jgi:hypothetical protein
MDGSTENVRACSPSLIEQTYGQVLVMLPTKLLETNRGGQAGWSPADNQHVKGHALPVGGHAALYDNIRYVVG